MPYFHTFGTRLRALGVFGWEQLHLERTTASQVRNGPVASDAKSDICRSGTVAGEGHTQGGLVIGCISGLGIFEVDSVGPKPLSHLCGYQETGAQVGTLPGLYGPGIEMKVLPSITEKCDTRAAVDITGTILRCSDFFLLFS